MKGKLVALVGVFCIASLIVPSAYADRPENPGKPDKPDKPRVPGQTKPECIVFSDNPEGSNFHGFLEGGQDEPISGCCLNAGPWPAYTMTLTNFGTLSGEHDGYLYVTFVATGPNQTYKIQFWTWDDDTEEPGADDFFIEIIGGDIKKDKKNKVLTVTFTDEAAWEYRSERWIGNLSFVLVRTSDLSYCD